jgi:hypothetical protein
VARADIHVVFKDGRWHVLVEGLGRSASIHERREGAIAAGREAARIARSELHIHDEHDPFGRAA